MKRIWNYLIASGYMFVWGGRFLVVRKTAPYLAWIFLALAIFEVLIACIESGHRILAGLPAAAQHYIEGFLAAIPGAVWVSTKVSENSAWVTWFSTASIVVAVVVFVHHEVMSRSRERLEKFLREFRHTILSAASLQHHSPKAIEEFLKNEALRTLALSMETHAKSVRFFSRCSRFCKRAWRKMRGRPPLSEARVVASLLEQEGDFFKTKYQWPPHAIELPANTLLSSESAAGRALKWRRQLLTQHPTLPPDAVCFLYIPRTSLCDAVVLWENRNKRHRYELDYEQSAFLPLSLSSSFQPKATVCFAMPFSNKHVLCVDSDSNNPFTVLDFQAIVLIGHVLAALQRMTDASVDQDPPTQAPCSKRSRKRSKVS